MKTKKNNSSFIFRMCILAVFTAVEVVVKMVGTIPVGPLNMSFVTIPVAIGAMILGNSAGALLGFIFGILSFFDAMNGRSAMTGAFFAADPFSTFLLCVGTRTLMGLLTALIWKGLNKIRCPRTVSCYIGALSAAVLNTILFMGYIVLFFFDNSYVAEKITQNPDMANPLMFIVLLVGVQGLVEAVAGCVVGGTVTLSLLANRKIRTIAESNER